VVLRKSLAIGFAGCSLQHEPEQRTSFGCVFNPDVTNMGPHNILADMQPKSPCWFPARLGVRTGAQIG
jgi:hypothetical protein